MWSQTCMCIHVHYLDWRQYIHDSSFGFKKEADNKHYKTKKFQQLVHKEVFNLPKKYQHAKA